jgi:hypothetical protein
MAKAADAATILNEDAQAPATKSFDVFLCHSIRDAELVQGAKRILEEQQLDVYVDWIVDPQMDRSAVTAETAAVLRGRMNRSRSLLYLFSNNSKRSRWMPWEIGYFDGRNGNVGVIPIRPDDGILDFSREEYLGLYPKVEILDSGIWVNRTVDAPVTGTDKRNYKSFGDWVTSNDKLRPF